MKKDIMIMESMKVGEDILKKGCPFNKIMKVVFEVAILVIVLGTLIFLICT